jgi:pyruvate dehydrogenase E1 component beta subunit
MSSKNRKLQYSLAINEALHQMMATDESIFLIGQGVKSPWYVGNTCQGLFEKFGPKRVIDTPVSENAITGAAVGAAIAGMRPIIVHPRMDFMMYAMDPIVNEAANWHYMCGGNSSVPVVFWGIINRGGEQAAQHSQAFHALFSHIPGLKVVMPATAYDAKGLLVAAIKENNPVVYIDDRWLYRYEDRVPEEIYEVKIGTSIIRRKGRDLTLVAISYMVFESIKAAQELKKEGIDIELIDLRTVKPFDEKLILKSVKKTGRMVIADVGWKAFGVSAEISARVMEKAFSCLKAPIKRVALPDTPAPASRALEREYYKNCENIILAVKEVMERK